MGLVQLDPLVLALAVALCVLGSARATRLWVHDTWPPVQWARERFLGWAEQTRTVSVDGAWLGRGRPGGPMAPGQRQELTWRAGWAPLATCPFCVAPWFALASIAWAYGSGLDWSSWAGQAWWLAHLWFAMSYLAAMVVIRDEPSDG